MAGRNDVRDIQIDWHAGTEPTAQATCRYGHVYSFLMNDANYSMDNFPDCPQCENDVRIRGKRIRLSGVRHHSMDHMRRLLHVQYHCGHTYQINEEWLYRFGGTASDPEIPDCPYCNGQRAVPSAVPLYHGGGVSATHAVYKTSFAASSASWPDKFEPLTAREWLDGEVRAVTAKALGL